MLLQERVFVIDRYGKRICMFYLFHILSESALVQFVGIKYL